MIYIPNNLNDELLDHIPDFTSWKEAEKWVKTGKQVVQQLSPKSVLGCEFTSLEWNDIEENKEASFGLYPSKKWRKFVLAVFLADLVSYTQLADQVNFERLLFVMHAFPQGFRVWWMKFPDHSWWPVGYTAWYPMFETMFEQLENKPERLKDRMIAPNGYSNNHKPYLYLFNYSAASVLKKSDLTRELMKKFAKDVQSQNAAGWACITVSADGVQVANRFGMTLSGYFTYEGCAEGVYVKRA